MEVGGMKRFFKKDSDLNFEDEKNISKSIRLLKREFLIKSIKASGLISLILLILIGYVILDLQPRIVFLNYLQIANYRPYSINLNLTIGWILFSASIFLIFYLINHLRVKFTPSLINYIKEELNYMGYEFQKKYTSGLLFVLLNSLSVVFMIYTDLEVFVFDNSIYSIVVRNLMIGYLIFSLVLPIIWIGVNDKYVIKIKENIYILFDFHFSLRKKRYHSPELLGITLSTNRLCSRFNKPGKNAHSKISEFRWLPRNANKINKVSPFLHFHEFSVPVNLQKQVLNVILALHEWDNNYEKELNAFNYDIALSSKYRERIIFDRFSNLFIHLIRL